VKEDAHARVAFPRIEESTELHMMTSNSCNIVNSALVMWLCREHEMAVKVTIALYGSNFALYTMKAYPESNTNNAPSLTLWVCNHLQTLCKLLPANF